MPSSDSGSSPKMVKPTDATNPSITAIKMSVGFSGAKLERDKGDFKTWVRVFRGFVTLNHLRGYIFEPLVRAPDRDEEPNAYRNYVENCDMALAALQTAVADSELEYIDWEKSPKACFDALRTRHQSAGPVRQIALIREALSTYCSHTEPLPTTVRRICDTIDQAYEMGEITRDLLKCFAILNSLNDRAFEAIQSTINRALSDATASNPYTSDQVRSLIDSEQTLINAKKRMQPLDTALVAKSAHTHNHGPNTDCCSICFGLGRRCGGHTSEWCVQKGGGCEGKTIPEAQKARAAHKTARKADKEKEKGTKSGSGGSTSTKISVLYTVNGKAYVAHVDPSDITEVAGGAPKQEFAGLASAPLPSSDSSVPHTHFAWLAAEGGNLTTGVHWSDFSKGTDASAFTAVEPSGWTNRPPIPLDISPFYADTGATCYLTPDPNDFTTITAIPPRSINGVGGSSIDAHGIGQIHLQTAEGKRLVLDNALYVPKSTVRLLSISALCINAHTTAHFNDEGVKIYDKSTGNFLVGGTLIPNQRLYALDLQFVSADRALAARQSTDLGTWHRRLGHANYQTIRAMAKSGTIADKDACTEEA
ncbi:hypothetical protein LshimejAT787_0103430 [Lyophyllum shimeji]|uniref:GAG-pre-integrase domain-containing protein n=1 Tax=Lyophyllum shimeji TaxID=47721 RepID=A0A9P3UH92_LYOSH|nr:hypothetical protein LshimejAT787_0103430 [Lyophyllum shimeji]